MNYAEEVRKLETELAAERRQQTQVQQELETLWRASLEDELVGKPSPKRQKQVELLKIRLVEFTQRISALEERLTKTRRLFQDDEYQHLRAQKLELRADAFQALEEMLAMYHRGVALREKVKELAERDVQVCYEWNQSHYPPEGGCRFPDGRQYLRPAIAHRVGNLLMNMFLVNLPGLETEVRRTMKSLAEGDTAPEDAETKPAKVQ